MYYYRCFRAKAHRKLQIPVLTLHLRPRPKEREKGEERYTFPSFLP
jgi:hypothetical protein